MVRQSEVDWSPVTAGVGYLLESKGKSQEALAADLISLYGEDVAAELVGMVDDMVDGAFGQDSGNH